MSALPVPPASSPDAQKRINYFNKLVELEKESIDLYPEESITLSVLRKNHEPVRFFNGFATCRAWGRTFHFHTASQRWICEVLWQSWQGRSDLLVKIDVDTVLEEAGLKPSNQLEKLFLNQKTRKPHEAMGFLIHQENGVAWMGPPMVQEPAPTVEKQQVKRRLKKR